MSPIAENLFELWLKAPLPQGEFELWLQEPEDESEDDALKQFKADFAAALPPYFLPVLYGMDDPRVRWVFQARSRRHRGVERTPRHPTRILPHLEP